MNARCDKIDCGAHATSVIGIQIFPSKSLMSHYQTDKPLTRLLLGLHVCDVHFKEIERDGVNNLMPAENLNPIIDMCERSSGTVVDKTATKLVQVPLTDPEYMMMKRAREAK